MRTRTAPPSDQPVSNQQPQSQLPKTTSKPSKTFILPSSASADARFVTLPNPRTGDPTRYFFCPKLGVYEFTTIASPTHSPRSILYASDPSADKASRGSISKTAELVVSTPVDIIFFVIPLLCSSPSSNKGKRLFQPWDDIIDSHDELPKHLRYVLCNDTFKNALLRRVGAVCDSVEAGDEIMFRVSERKILQELLAKAERMIAQGLPTSLEERFVKQALAVPLMSVTRTDIATSGASLTSPEKHENETESQEGMDAQSTIMTTTSTAPSSASTSTPISESVPTPVGEEFPDEQANPESTTMVRLQRLSTALSFLKTSYISSELCTKLDEMLSGSETPVDFNPLRKHLKHLAELRAEALASRSLGDFSRKRNSEDEDVAESRAEKKRRKEEEEKKKNAGESRGVRELKKVNTAGMKKMSDFFGKTAAKKS